MDGRGDAGGGAVYVLMLATIWGRNGVLANYFALPVIVWDAASFRRLREP